MKKGESDLVQVAIDAGAKVIEVLETGSVEELFKSAPDTMQVLGDGKVHFHEQLPRVEFGNLVDNEFLIKGINMVENWDGIFGTSTFGLLWVLDRSGKEFTTLAGGKAVVRQCQQFLSKRRFPIKVNLTRRPGPNGEYYIFE